MNLLVGDQGMGKSTVLFLMRESARKDAVLKGEKLADIFEYQADPIALAAFDFEKDNPRIQSAFSDRMDMGFQGEQNGVCRLPREVSKTKKARATCLADRLQNREAVYGLRSCVSVLRHGFRSPGRRAEER